MAIGRSFGFIPPKKSGTRRALMDGSYGDVLAAKTRADSFFSRLLTLQLQFSRDSESMRRHDLEVMDGGSID
jgi:hypothetical protein